MHIWSFRPMMCPVMHALEYAITGMCLPGSIEPYLYLKVAPCPCPLLHPGRGSGLAMSPVSFMNHANASIHPCTGSGLFATHATDMHGISKWTTNLVRQGGPASNQPVKCCVGLRITIRPAATTVFRLLGETLPHVGKSRHVGTGWLVALSTAKS